VWAVVTTLAGGVSGTIGAFKNASGTNAGFNAPMGVAVDLSGNVFVADTGNNRIRKVTAVGGTHICPVMLRACYADVLCVCSGVSVQQFSPLEISSLRSSHSAAGPLVLLSLFVFCTESAFCEISRRR
jgi:hypothetical protein